jgi:large subunit ribosomal protein L32
MPVPKNRLGRSDQGHRRSQWKATLPTLTSCSNCGTAIETHVICPVCGFYKGRVVSERFAKKSGYAAAMAPQPPEDNVG